MVMPLQLVRHCPEATRKARSCEKATRGTKFGLLRDAGASNFLQLRFSEAHLLIFRTPSLAYRTPLRDDLADLLTDKLTSECPRSAWA